MSEPFQLNTRKSFGYEIFDLEGELERDQMIRLDNIIQRAVPEGIAIILNMEEVTYISATALGLLITMNKNLPITMYIMSASDSLKRIFESHHAAKIFDFIPSEKHLAAKEKSRDLDNILNDPEDI